MQILQHMTIVREKLLWQLLREVRSSFLTCIFTALMLGGASWQHSFPPFDLAGTRCDLMWALRFKNRKRPYQRCKGQQRRYVNNAAVRITFAYFD
eukprot:591982-Amphidinium_carterae.2